MKKLSFQRNVYVIGFMLMTSIAQLHPFSSTMNHRPITSSPLLYKQIDYSQEQLSIEFEPLISGMFDPGHAIANITPNGSATLSFSQDGTGDVNPAWLYLQSPFLDAYRSVVTFTPTQQIYGLLFHTYKQFEYLFLDFKTSLLSCTTKIEISEAGGGNGILETDNGEVVYDAYGAFTQNDYQYAKMGDARSLIGIDDIQLMFGVSTQIDTMQSSHTNSWFAAFGLIEVPTGAGTKAEWVFEPQVGSNHWAFGFGVDLMFENENELSFVFGGNFRHFIANWETRTFDLLGNGAWSRYLLVESLDSMPSGLHVGLANITTVDALIEGRNQINMYGRLQKRFESCLFEVSYNLFYNEAETISQARSISSGYGIYAIQTAGGVTTASGATIKENLPPLDLSDPVELTTSDLDLTSAAAKEWLSNSIAVRLQRVQEFYTYGIGASVDLASTAQALSNWSVWANFEILLP